jgi:hypothetical protein
MKNMPVGGRSYETSPHSIDMIKHKFNWLMPFINYHNYLENDIIQVATFCGENAELFIV